MTSNRIIIILILLAMTSCTSGRLRLYKGVNENEGNLQICTNGTWSQVTSYDWDSLDGEVACRQLGLLHSGGTSELCITPRYWLTIP